MAAERVVWCLWADSLVLAIPNNSGQSDCCMVTCLPKSRAKLVGNESQAPFSSIFCHRRPATRRRYSCIRGEMFLHPFQPEQGSFCALWCFLRYLFDLLKNQVPSVEELAAEEQVRKHCEEQRLTSFLPPPQKTVWGLTTSFLVQRSGGSTDCWNAIMPYRGRVNKLTPICGPTSEVTVPVIRLHVI